MIDSHCHLLPAIDDGAGDEAEALAMAAVAVDDGIDTVIVTPHMREGDYPTEPEQVLQAVESFREVLERQGVPLRIEAGAEVHLTTNMVERIRDGRLLTYANRRQYLLLECPYRTRPVNLDHVIFELRVAGVTPVIAHPERIRFFLEDESRYEEIVRMGAIGQLTSSSLLGVFGREIQATSESWVRRRLVHILASDAHDPSYRPPALNDARRRWAGLDDEEHARMATVDFPEALISGAPIEPSPPIDEEPPRGFLRRLFS